MNKITKAAQLHVHGIYTVCTCILSYTDTIDTIMCISSEKGGNRKNNKNP